jgi:DNA-binding NtrC family response regulator
MARILIADDNPNSRLLLKEILESAGYCVNESADWKKAAANACLVAHDLIFLSLGFPRNGGIRALRMIIDECPETPVVVMVEAESIASAVGAMKLGAVQYITHPINPDEVLIVAETTINNCHSSEHSKRVVEGLRRYHGILSMVGRSPAAKKAYSTASKAAKSDEPILIVGEHGTGKSCLAKAIHYESSRVGEAFVKINCQREKDKLSSPAIPDWVDKANGGTAFFCTIDCLSDSEQSVLLEMLQTVGNGSNVRFIAGTVNDPANNSNLNVELIAALSAITISVPPLRERREDIPEIATHLLLNYADEMGKAVSTISEQALACLTAHEWYGNVMELRNCIERAVLACDGKSIEPPHLSLSDGQFGATAKKPQSRMKSLRDVERDHIRRVLKQCNWNRSLAAEVLEIDRKTLRSKIREFGFIPPEIQ